MDHNIRWARIDNIMQTVHDAIRLLDYLQIPADDAQIDLRIMLINAMLDQLREFEISHPSRIELDLAQM